MIKKIFDFYDDSQCFVFQNDKEIAGDNINNIRNGINFIVLFFVAYVVLTIYYIIRGGWSPIDVIPVLSLFLFWWIVRLLFNGIKESLIKVRIFSLFFYGITILLFGCTEAISKPEQRSVYLPVGLLLFSILYVDYLAVILVFKVIVVALFLFADFFIKEREIFLNDIFLGILTLLITTLCYYSTLTITIKRIDKNKSYVENSEHDLLTGLLNKLTFENMSKDLLDNRLIGSKATLFIFDFDNFKGVNDKYGHKIGDEALKLFANILKTYYHSIDVVGRVGGDEFMVLVMGETNDNFVDLRCTNIQHDLKIARIGDGTIGGFSCSIGVCEDTKGGTFDDLYKTADKALYKAKENGKSCHFVLKR